MKNIFLIAIISFFIFGFDSISKVDQATKSGKELGVYIIPSDDNYGIIIYWDDSIFNRDGIDTLLIHLDLEVPDGWFPFVFPPAVADTPLIIIPGLSYNDSLIYHFGLKTIVAGDLINQFAPMGYVNYRNDLLYRIDGKSTAGDIQTLMESKIKVRASPEFDWDNVMPIWEVRNDSLHWQRSTADFKTNQPFPSFLKVQGYMITNPNSAYVAGDTNYEFTGEQNWLIIPPTGLPDTTDLVYPLSDWSIVSGDTILLYLNLFETSSYFEYYSPSISYKDTLFVP